MLPHHSSSSAHTPQFFSRVIQQSATMPRQNAATVKRPGVDRQERRGAPAPDETKVRAALVITPGAPIEVALLCSIMRAHPRGGHLLRYPCGPPLLLLGPAGQGPRHQTRPPRPQQILLLLPAAVWGPDTGHSSMCGHSWVLRPTRRLAGVEACRLAAAGARGATHS